MLLADGGTEGHTFVEKQQRFEVDDFHWRLCTVFIFLCRWSVLWLSLYIRTFFFICSGMWNFMFLTLRLL